MTKLEKRGIHIGERGGDMLKERLFELRDEVYKDFQSKLMPTVERDSVIGVRVPVLRKFAKEISGTEIAEIFMRELPHQYYEENCLHGFLIEQIKDFDACTEELDRFLPFIDNWAVCDMTSPKVLNTDTERLSLKIKEWIESENPYTVRYGIVMLMRYYLEERFDDSYPALVASVKSDDYYVNMAVAWYFSTALAMQYERIIPYFENRRLDVWIHNKALQKAIESYRISSVKKDYIRKLKNYD